MRWVQWYEYFLFAMICVHMACITFQSGSSAYGPNFFVRHPNRSVVDGIEMAALNLYTCALGPTVTEPQSAPGIYRDCTAQHLESWG